MVIHVRFFAVLRERTGVSSWELDCPEGTTLGAAAAKIQTQFPLLKPYARRIAYAVNQSCDVPIGATLHEGDEVALIPPVSGGAGDDWIEITDKPLDTAAAVRFVSQPGAGGIDIFLGTTRSDTNAAGQALIALDYEAYGEMASKQLTAMAKAAREKWPIVRIVILHRTGRVHLAEPSVLIAVSAPHRGEAFEACRWLIDGLKKEAAIWKKEIWRDGPATWSGEKS